MPPPFDRIAVLGLGLIGGSVLQALARGGYRVVGYDPNPDEAGAARGAGYDLAATAADAVRDADLVVLAMPLPRAAGRAAINPARASDPTRWSPTSAP